ncbi:UNKNOWN [Stylonychia lemnae]|uniref:Dynein light chain n=1 Tax=Stylonychia lemnae TaxID=5949 RepID=A0A078A4E7_STYLE|nr:UNKNOWN [Stylonychia lemnae]|eukprot:CDW77128.1 UNKNOWN [Stylonychia lemnae]
MKMPVQKANKKVQTDYDAAFLIEIERQTRLATLEQTNQQPINNNFQKSQQFQTLTGTNSIKKEQLDQNSSDNSEEDNLANDTSFMNQSVFFNNSSVLRREIQNHIQSNNETRQKQKDDNINEMNSKASLESIFSSNYFSTPIQSQTQEDKIKPAQQNFQTINQGFYGKSLNSYQPFMFEKSYQPNQVNGNPFQLNQNMAQQYQQQLNQHQQQQFQANQFMSVVFGHIRVECEQILNQVCAKIFQNKEYNQTSVATQIGQTNEEAIKHLLNNNQNFKYMVVTSVMQKKAAASETLDFTSSCFWNSSTDGQTAIRWENDHLYVIITLFSCAL